MAFVLLSCSKSKEESGNVKGTGKVSFKVNGTLVTTNVWVFNRFDVANNLYNFTTNMHLDKKTILLNLTNPVSDLPINVGGLSSGNYGTYSPEYGNLDKNATITSGTISNIKLNKDKKLVSFDFMLNAESSSGQKYSITEGKVENGEIGPDQELKL